MIDEVVDRDLMGNAERMGERLRAGPRGPEEALAADRRRPRPRAAERASSSSPTARRKATFGAGVDPGDLLRVNATRHGILLYARRQNGGLFGDWSVIAPPLIVTEAEIDEIVERLGPAVDDAAAELLG